MSLWSLPKKKYPYYLTFKCLMLKFRNILIKFLLKKYNFMISKFRTKVLTQPYKTAEYGVWSFYQIVLPKTQQNRISIYIHTITASKVNSHVMDDKSKWKNNHPSFSGINDPTLVENIICLRWGFYSKHCFKWNNFKLGQQVYLTYSRNYL